MGQDRTAGPRAADDRDADHPTRLGGSGGAVFGALGDIHGAFDAARAILARHPEVPFWLCVGDIADDAGRYEPLGAPVYWIHGNNDNFDAIAAGDLPADLHHIANGTSIEIAGSESAGSESPGLDESAGPKAAGFNRAGDDEKARRPGVNQKAGPLSDVARTSQVRLRVAGLGGTFAPTWYETAAADLPHPKKGTAKATELADKRRHFVREEVDACTRLREIDVFMSHEAAKPFRVFPAGRGPDAGKSQINEVLAAMKPRLHLFGHHHRFTDEVREGVRSVGLDLAAKGYLLIDALTLGYEARSL